jgi:hypothetical protein
VVENYYFPNPQRPPAVFEHDAHNEKADLFDCAECHHVYDEEGQKLEWDSSEDQACADCHGLSDQGRMPGLRKAFHQNCRGCHLTVQKGPFMRAVPCKTVTRTRRMPRIWAGEMAKKILIIDDDPVILKYLQALFEDNGYATCTATSSMEGLQLVSPKSRI